MVGMQRYADEVAEECLIHGPGTSYSRCVDEVVAVGGNDFIEDVDVSLGCETIEVVEEELGVLVRVGRERTEGQPPFGLAVGADVGERDFEDLALDGAEVIVLTDEETTLDRLGEELGVKVAEQFEFHLTGCRASGDACLDNLVVGALDHS